MSATRDEEVNIERAGEPHINSRLPPEEASEATRSDEDRAFPSSGKFLRSEDLIVRRWLQGTDMSDGEYTGRHISEITWDVLRRIRWEGQRAVDKESGSTKGKGVEQREELTQQERDAKLQDQDLRAIMDLVGPALDSSLTKGTKRQKTSMLRHC